MKEKSIAIKEVTPLSFRCVGLLACPSIFATDEDTFIIIGKTLENTEAKKLLGDRIAGDETAVVVPKGIITELFKKQE